MGKQLDITGKKFGKLTAIRIFGRDKRNKIQWLCECDCGKYTLAKVSELTKGVRKSCGCARIIHGMSHSRLYTIWNDMKQRCQDPKTNGYHNYGGRGIAVCEEWQKFEPFKEWALSHGYDDCLTLDRINANQGYTPDNCRFVTLHVQSNNRRNNHYISCNGVTHTLAEWSEMTGLSRSTITHRIDKGWKPERALSEPPSSSKKHLTAKNINTGEILWFESSKEAERMGFSRPSIWRCLSGEYSHHKGYRWEYAP